MIGLTLAWLLAAGMLALGVATFPLPSWMSRVYGAPTGDPGGLTFVRATGLRDLILGGCLVALLGMGDETGAAVICAGTGLCAVGDLAMVVARRGLSALPQLAVHASGIAMGLVSGALLAAGV